MTCQEEINPISEQDKIRWEYNCLDVLYTLEIALRQKEFLEDIKGTKLEEFYNFQQERIAPALVKVMNRGVRIDLAKKELLFKELTILLKEVEEKLNYLLGENFNPKSTPQIKEIFKNLFGITPKINKKTKQESFGSIHMFEYIKEYPMFVPFITLLLEYRSIGVFLRTFVAAEVDPDGRMRTSYGVAGTKTYRLSSRKNAFGCGANLANIPSKGKINLKYSLASIEHSEDTEGDEEIDTLGDNYEGLTKLPNCKEFFIPDPGWTFFNADYSGADAMVVAWDSDCKWLQNFFLKENMKLYIYVASHYLQREITTEDRWYKIFKQYIHGTNYGMMEEKAAMNAGIPISEARKLRKWYFSLCPEIPDWHKRIKSDIKSKGYVENIFGARGWFLNTDSPTILNQAIAWIPQSTIAILVNKALVNIEENETDIQVLLQVHDALAGQYRLEDKEAEKRIISHMEIELPYKKPLIIPADFSFSKKSYGDCK